MFNPYQAQIDELIAKIQETQRLLEDPDFAELAKAELDSLVQQKQALDEAALQYEQNMDGGDTQTSDERVNCTIEVRSGAGGDEAKIWGNDLIRMYIRFAEMYKLKITYIDDMVIKVSGKTTEFPKLNKEGKSYITAYELLKYESGVHRVQRVPATEAQGRIHTSTASIAVLPEIASKEIEIREEDIEWQFMRSSGAGGQSVNKTSSAARLTHKPTGIVIVSRQEKKQEQNRKIALELLRSQLWEIEEEKKEKELGKARSAIGRAQRAEKIRTYNYPQNRITDHRTKQSWYDLPNIMEGYMGKLISELHPVLDKLYSGEEIEISGSDSEFDE
ncbi:MAG: peptide chain release factor 1 [Patescibacteria group bacterium]|nr:MAG: peptide chain release factor 1 [Patescibacteria group bacterium]